MLSRGNGGFAWLLSRLRRERGMTQTDVASRLRISQGMVSHLKTGRAQPSPDVLEALQSLLLFSGVASNPREAKEKAESSFGNSEKPCHLSPPKMYFRPSGPPLVEDECPGGLRDSLEAQKAIAELGPARKNRKRGPAPSSGIFKRKLYWWMADREP